MLTVDKYARIRRAYRDGMPIREIARRFHHSRRKVREALGQPEPPGRLHVNSLSEQHLLQVGVIPTGGEAFVLHADL